MHCRTFHALALGAFLVCSTGCNLTGLVIKSQVDGTREFTEAKGKELADPEMVGPVMAAGIVTAEGYLYYVPDYEPLLQSTIFANIAYGVGWLGAEAHKAELANKLDDAERINKRAGLLFMRALQLSKRMLRLRDDGFDAAMGAGLDSFKRWVDENFFEKDDAEVLLTAGIAYFVGMLKSEDGIAAAVDVPYASYMVERSIELNPKAMDAQGLAVLGIYQCTLPEMVGGNPRLGKELIERAIALTDGKSHGHYIALADRCAVALQDRKLFHDTLMKVIEAGDEPKYRLPNKLARHSAERMLTQIDELFYD